MPSLTLVQVSKGLVHYMKRTLETSESSNFVHYCEKKKTKPKPNKKPNSGIYKKLTSYPNIKSLLNGDFKYLVKEKIIVSV